LDEHARAKGHFSGMLCEPHVAAKIRSRGVAFQVTPTSVDSLA
jgi:hypothetical protein